MAFKGRSIVQHADSPLEIINGNDGNNRDRKPMKRMYVIISKAACARAWIANDSYDNTIIIGAGTN